MAKIMATNKEAQPIPPPPGGGSWRWDGAAWQSTAAPQTDAVAGTAPDKANEASAETPATS